MKLPDWLYIPSYILIPLLGASLFYAGEPWSVILMIAATATLLSFAGRAVILRLEK